MSDCGSVSSVDSSHGAEDQPMVDIVFPVGVETEVPQTDGGLHKTVLVEGTGTKPLRGSKVSVHYVGTLASDGSKFDSSRDRGEYFVFTLGRGQVIKGWDKGVATMRVGEKAILKCSPEYGYGASGSPPKIPANATLLFEVELFDWTKEEDIGSKKDRTLMKSIEIEGVDYETPGFESRVVADVKAFAGLSTEGVEPLLSNVGWTIEIGESELPPRLEECLSSMKRKESAVFKVSGHDGSGAILTEESAAFHIPAGSDLTYVVEVHELTTVKTWKYHGMEKVTEGNTRKEQGNTAFKAGNLDYAERKYRRALEFVESDYGFDDEAKAAGKASRIACWSNLAQVLLLKKNYKESVTYSNKVLDVDAGHAKSRFRKAKALFLLSEWDQAKTEVKPLAEMAPSDTNAATIAEAKALLREINTKQRDFDKKQKAAFKNLFA